jgi:hypothetical protein
MYLPFPPYCITVSQKIQRKSRRRDENLIERRERITGEVAFLKKSSAKNFSGIGYKKKDKIDL